LYDASEELPDSEYFKDRFAYFGSIHPTLIHFLVGDTIWPSLLHWSPP
jgi:uncharacterized damage-inducible protein DinB